MKTIYTSLFFCSWIVSFLSCRQQQRVQEALPFPACILQGQENNNNCRDWTKLFLPAGENEHMPVNNPSTQIYQVKTTRFFSVLPCVIVVTALYLQRFVTLTCASSYTITFFSYQERVSLKELIFGGHVPPLIKCSPTALPPPVVLACCHRGCYTVQEYFREKGDSKIYFS